MSYRVLYVAHNHPSVRPGGAEQHALELHRAMAGTKGIESVFLAKGGPPVGPGGSRHEGTYVAPVSQRPDEYFLYTDGYDFDYINGSITDKDFYTKHFRAFLMSIKPDIVHFQHTLHLGYELIREVRNSLPDAPIVYTLHEYLPICARDGQMVRTRDDQLCDEATPNRCHECFPHISPQSFFLRKRLIQSHLDLVDLFLAPSQFLLQRFVDWGVPPSKIRFEDYGRASTIVQPDPPRAQRTRLGYFGQINRFKGVQVLLEAMKLLEKEGASATLRIHGANLDIQDGEFKRTIAELLEETKRSVTMAGRYSAAEQPALIRNVDWVVVPSIWWENSPLVIQEAFLNGRPVICSNVGGMAEKVDHGVSGLHFQVGDARSLADAILQATTGTEIWDRMQRGIPPVYSLDEQVEKLSALYGELISSRVASRREPYAAAQ
jgi:glycosyltransferase involved in cell wall biosynthesis